MMSVRERDAMLERAEGAILARAVTPKSTAQLVRELREQGIGEYFVRAGVLFLLDRGKLVPGDGLEVMVAPRQV